MKKFVVKTIITSLIIALIIWGASLLFSFSYSEYSFFIGLVITVALLFVKGSGATPLANFDAIELGFANTIQKDEEPKINGGFIFYGFALYTIVSFILMIVM